MRRVFGSLSNRIFLAATLLAWLSIAAALLFVNARLARDSAAALDRRLIETARLVQEQRQALLDTYRRTAALVADLPKLKAAMATLDPPTVEPVADQYARDLNADLFVVQGPTGELLASAGPAARAAAPVVLARSAPDAGSTWWHPLTRGLLQVVTVPVLLGVESPERLGTLSVGFVLDDRRAADLKRVAGVDLAFVLNAPATPASTTSAAPNGVVVASTLATTPTHWPVALARPASGRLSLAETPFAWRSQPLDAAGADADPPGEGRVPVVVVLEPTAATAATLRDVRYALGGIALLTAGLAVAVSYGVARSVTRPLAAMTSAMHEMARTGDLRQRFPEQARGLWSDDDTRVLATTFNALTASIETFQREARERERLSALGRLSTVIAHEIRNPLMIVRGALRQLTRAPGASPEVLDAAADIEEEVQRLNRVVDDVLDFARPVHLVLAPTDVNAVVREAVAAATAAQPDVPIHTECEPALPRIACDADRLRAVLVNVLTNAQQALAGGATDAPCVQVASSRTIDGDVRLRVRDNGPGISDADLAHVFDPYFTTRRTGTGLGLAIARAIVQALGGQIAMTSAAGQGSTVTIDLPARQS